MEKNVQIIFAFSFILLAGFTIFIRHLQKKKAHSADELMARVQTFWAMLLLLFIAATTPLIVTYVLFAALSALALYEYLSWQKLSAKNHVILDSNSRALAFVLVPLQIFCLYRGYLAAAFTIIPFCLVAVFPTMLVLRNRTEHVLTTYGFLASGLLFFVMAFPLAADLTRYGLMPVLLCFLLTELRDLFSYWLGKFFSKQAGKNPSSGFLRIMNKKIAPEVSPNKSWAVGLISAFLLVFINLSFIGLMTDSAAGEVSVGFMIAWAFAIGITGLFGDLVFSLFKREFGLKDSGSLLPGSTGIIDRIDSLILTVPTTYLLFHFFAF